MLDFRGQQGLLVRYSPHYRKSHSSQNWNVVGKRVGVVVETKVYQEDGVLVTYPIVAWEGVGGVGSLTHPMNVVPFRRGVKLPALPKGDR